MTVTCFRQGLNVLCFNFFYQCLVWFGQRSSFQRAIACMLQRALCYRPSVCLSVRHTGGSVKDGSRQDHAIFTTVQPHDSSFLTRNGTLKFQRQHRERGRRIREGYEKNVTSATAAIVFRFTRRRSYRALSWRQQAFLVWDVTVLRIIQSAFAFRGEIKMLQ